MRRLQLIFSSLMLMASCSVDPYPHKLPPFPVPAGGYKCLVIGDWGRKGNVNELANAHMMNQLACRLSIDAVLTTGDNFYSNGVMSLHDEHWDASFEHVFNGSCLQPVPWWPSLGNHDVRGSIEAQIEYSDLSDRWDFPSDYYDRWVLTDDSVSVHLVIVDTSPFVLQYYQSPDNSAMLSHISQADTARQLAWLDSVLEAGDPDWLVVYGHHPVYAAGGYHGPTLELIEKFAPRFEEKGVDVYFCGHNHSLELIKTNQKTLYVTSGGGSLGQERIELDTYNLFGTTEPGFVLSSFAKDSLQLDFISKSGERLFSYVNHQTP